MTTAYSRIAGQKGDIPSDVPGAVCRRITIAQSFYAFGALLWVIRTDWSIALIVMVQLYYALAPRLAE
jgi:hypothetical protein